MYYFQQILLGYLEITINLRNCPFQIDKIFISFLISFLATYFTINNDELEIFFRKKLTFQVVQGSKGGVWYLLWPFKSYKSSLTSHDRKCNPILTKKN